MPQVSCLENPLPDTSGEVYPEPHAANFGANDRYPSIVWVFNDGSTRIGLGFSFTIPEDYNAGATFEIGWSTTVTTGNRVRWEIDYRAIAAGESFDPSTDQENLVLNAAPPATARDLEKDTLAATDGNFSPGDRVIGALFRDNAEASPNDDDVAADVYLSDLRFDYTT